MDEYRGRLSCDGNGNLLAYDAELVGNKTVLVHDEHGNLVRDVGGNVVQITIPVLAYGENHNRPVAQDLETGKFVFVEQGEMSHNDRYHENFATITGTVDETMTDDSSLVNAWRDGENAHHFGVQERGMGPSHLPDSIAPVTTGHTDAYVDASSE